MANKLFCVTLDCNVVFSTSVQVSIPITATVSGGNLGETYKAVQFHLHWGTNGGPGSEHTVDGEQYPMELHIVHMKQRFNRLEDALRDPSGIAVLGFFYEESSSSNRKYDLFTHGLRSIQNTSKKVFMCNVADET
ncbi:carbonic anhydrase 9-like [Sinocyclocheilus grahami]|uniref:carbonic anhydrase 9-like n=1 Tax=Sinocyclocheilus grahami TaxID=75366 RepID=UPI0007AD156E|nr:PREDICTED: carbonic anhydrase 9-like [Sinocyclocheilus grahami]